MPFMGASHSRFLEIATELPERTREVAKLGAEKVAEGARERVPVRTRRLHDAIHVEESEEIGEFAVIAGDNKAWYGHIVEFGAVHNGSHKTERKHTKRASVPAGATGARPFLLPAAEAVRDELNELGRAALADL